MSGVDQFDFSVLPPGLPVVRMVEPGIVQGMVEYATMAVLFEPDGAGNGSFLLTGNYRVILHYNCSNYYALSVGLLADEIAR